MDQTVPSTKELYEKVNELSERVSKLEMQPSDIKWRMEHLEAHHNKDRVYSYALRTLDFIDRHKFLILALSFWAIGHALEYME